MCAFTYGCVFSETGLLKFLPPCRVFCVVVFLTLGFSWGRGPGFPHVCMLQEGRNTFPQHLDTAWHGTGPEDTWVEWMKLTVCRLAGRKAFRKVRLGVQSCPWPCGILAGNWTCQSYCSDKALVTFADAFTPLSLPWGPSEFSETTWGILEILPFLTGLHEGGSVFMELKPPRSVVRGQLCPPPNPSVEIQNVTVFGSLEERVKFKMKRELSSKSYGWASVQYNWCPFFFKTF